MPLVNIAPARPGLIIRHPADGLPLPASGRLVELDSYWSRRVADGDAVLVADPAPAQAPAQAQNKTAAKAAGE